MAPFKRTEPVREAAPAALLGPASAAVTSPPLDYGAEVARFQHDRRAMKDARPKTEPEVKAILKKDADQCIDSGTDNICMWFYATKDPAAGRDVIGVTFRAGKVILADY